MWLHPHNLLALMLVAIAARAAFIDHQSGIIPNRLVAIGGVSLLAARALFAALLRGPNQIGTALIVGILGGLVTGLPALALYCMRGIGGGDVKLLGCCGAGLGPVVGLEAELYAFGLGALYALGFAAWSGRLWATLRGTTLLFTNPLLPARMRLPVAPEALTPLRFGPAICAGVIVAVALHWRQP